MNTVILLISALFLNSCFTNKEKISVNENPEKDSILIGKTAEPVTPDSSEKISERKPDVIEFYRIGPEFLEMKYSKNDIKRQRENFKKEKIKSVSFKKDSILYGYTFDTKGRFKRESMDDSGWEYKYEGDKLKTRYGSMEIDLDFSYDERGNIIEVCLCDAGSYSFYYFDSENKLIKTYHKYFDGIKWTTSKCYSSKIKYKNNRISSIMFLCCERKKGSEDNYEMYVKYNYSKDGKLIKCNYYLLSCSDNERELFSFQEYFYKENSNFPYMMIQDSVEINFTYDYYN